MPGVDRRYTTVPQQLPAPGDLRSIFACHSRLHSQVAGEGDTGVEHETDAVIRMAWRVNDLAGDTDRGEERPALGTGNDDVVARRDFGVIVRRLRPLLHQRNRVHLLLHDEQRHTPALEIFRGAGMIDVVVRGEPVAEFIERHAHPVEVREQGASHSRPTQVDQQAIPPGTHDPEIRGAVADVDDGGRNKTGH